MNKEDREPIVFVEDLIKEYTEGRKALDESDVRDLVNCLFGYIKQRIRSKETYAIDIPYIGILHKKFNIDDVTYNVNSSDEKLTEKLFINRLLKPNSPSNRKPKFNNEDKEYLQWFTNTDQD